MGMGEPLVPPWAPPCVRFWLAAVVVGRCLVVAVGRRVVGLPPGEARLRRSLVVVCRER